MIKIEKFEKIQFDLFLLGTGKYEAFTRDGKQATFLIINEFPFYNCDFFIEKEGIFNFTKDGTNNTANHFIFNDPIVGNINYDLFLIKKEDIAISLLASIFEKMKEEKEKLEKEYKITKLQKKQNNACNKR